MESPNLEVLKSLKDLVEALKNRAPMTVGEAKAWAEREAKVMQELNEKSKKEQDSMTMSHEKLHTPFTM